MPRQKKIPPVILKRLDDWRVKQDCSVRDLSKETGLTYDFLMKHLDVENIVAPPVQPPQILQEVAPENIDVSDMAKRGFARKEGVCIMTNPGLVDEINNSQAKRFEKSSRSESHIFRGNKAAPQDTFGGTNRNFPS